MSPSLHELLQGGSDVDICGLKLKRFEALLDAQLGHARDGVLGRLHPFLKPDHMILTPAGKHGVGRRLRGREIVLSAGVLREEAG